MIRSKRLSTFAIVFVSFASAVSGAEESSRSFLSMRQKGELIWRGEVTDAHDAKYRMFVVPGYVRPAKNIADGWSSGGDRLLDYGRAKPYTGIWNGWTQSAHGADHLWSGFFARGIARSWTENFDMANQARKNGTFAWYLAYPYALGSSVLSSVFRLGGAAVGTAGIAVYAVGLRPAYELASPAVRGAWNIGVAGTAYPVLRMGVNTLLAPPLSLIEFEPTPKSADGFWVRQISGTAWYDTPRPSTGRSLSDRENPVAPPIERPVPVSHVIDQEFASPVLENRTEKDGGLIGAVVLQGPNVLFGGDFDYVNGLPLRGLVRLNASGQVDNLFQKRLPGSIQRVRGILIQPDGKILVVNNISTLIRLNADGSADPTFTPFYNSGNIWNVRLQPDGKILYLNTSTESSYIARRLANGRDDSGFTRISRLEGNFGATKAGGVIHAFEVESDGRIVIAGDFDRVDGHEKRSVARLLRDGTVDTTFTAPMLTEGPGLILVPGYRSSAMEIHPVAQGRYLVRPGLGFASAHGYRQLLRLNRDGTFDDSFSHIDTDGFISDMAVSDPKNIYLAGECKKANGRSVSNGLVRLDRDGKLDEHFRSIDLPLAATIRGIYPDKMDKLLLTTVSRDAEKKWHWTLLRLRPARPEERRI